MPSRNFPLQLLLIFAPEAGSNAHSTSLQTRSCAATAIAQVMDHSNDEDELLDVQGSWCSERVHSAGQEED